MKTILVATDFSQASLNAGYYAADLAMAVNAGIYLLHIIQVPVSYAGMPVPVNMDDWMKEASAKLTTLKTTLADRTSKRISIAHEVAVGTFYHEFKKACDERKPYAVVMGSQGTTATERFFLGSHTIYAMKHLPWPLVTVPPTASFAGVKKIGLACDFKDIRASVPAGEIKEIVHAFKAQLHILHTGKSFYNDAAIISESGTLRQMLNDLVPQYHFIANENTDEGILDFVKANEIDLLIILPKKHSLIDQFIHKSQAAQICSYCQVPVLSLYE